MGTISRYYGSRMVPTPVGIPPVEFRRYTYNQMKPLAVEPTNLIFNDTEQRLLRILIPANYWGWKKRLLIDFGFFTTLGDHSFGNDFEVTEMYLVNATGTMVQGGGGIYSGSGGTGRHILQMQLIREGDDIFDITPFVNKSHQSVGDLLTGDAFLQVNGPLTAVNFSEDIFLDIILQSINADGTDAIEVLYAKAFIESPLNIQRFT